jgi:hypothetical protein
MAKPTTGYQAENQFYQSALSAKGCPIGGYIFMNPRDLTKQTSLDECCDFLCDVMHPTSGLLRDVRVELKASRKGTVLLTEKESLMASRSNYDSDYFLIVYRHTAKSIIKNQFKPKVVSTNAFKAATTQLRVKA